MKKLLPLLLLILIGCSEPELKIIDLNNESIIKDGVYLDKKSLKPLSGKVIKTSQDNVVIIEGIISNGLPDGEWIEWYPNGNKFFSGIYSKGIKDGLFTFYDINGDLKSEIEYKNDVFNGIYKDQSSEGVYLDGKKNGIWKTYLSGEVLSEIEYKNDVFDGIYKTLSDQGFYVSGVKDGLWKELDSINNIISEGSYVEGKKNGLWIKTNQNTQETISEIEYKNDVFNGIYKDQSSEGVYLDGKKNGIWKTYFNGEVISEIEYRNDIFDGSYEGVDDEGNIISGTYKNGKKNGRWKESRYFTSRDVYEFISEGNYNDDIKDGQWSFIINKMVGDFVNEKKVFSINCIFENGILNGPFKLEKDGEVFRSDSWLRNEIIFDNLNTSNILPSGLEEFTPDDYNFIQGFFKNGNKEKKFILSRHSVNGNSNSRKVMIKNYKNGLKDGQSVTFHQSLLTVIPFDFNNKDFHKTINSFTINNYKNDKLDGETLYYVKVRDMKTGEFSFLPYLIENYENGGKNGWLRYYHIDKKKYGYVTPENKPYRMTDLYRDQKDVLMNEFSLYLNDIIVYLEIEYFSPRIIKGDIEKFEFNKDYIYWKTFMGKGRFGRNTGKNDLLDYGFQNRYPIELPNIEKYQNGWMWENQEYFNTYYDQKDKRKSSLPLIYIDELIK
uniref:Uncharacterized protein conserved in bacteria n=1 Tax=uncultured Fidelibacterota bacterium HF0010_18O13 TaxID=710789 RepID=E0XR86_9BACT|nr:uncharacterized protein conserved in bacteria [uncultured Marinimicrobia bacterium HF0010_18O13]